MRHETAALRRVRALCLAMPETQERQSHGEAAWFVGGKRQFVMYADRHHDEREGFWAAAPEGVQGQLVAEATDRYFRPPYVGGRGWVGVWVDVPDVDWDRVEAIIQDAWRTVAPPTIRRLAD
ncbi:conserved hypothetical protein [Nostocoides japonicum T1-X7]|uniref:Phosphoribosylglycinamide formyltransferase n=1 Tax=Nostocoides japonicum T1-X7 TaxID=1194083 RepID=A0A077M3W3_9MICO|nr:MmcQ/YjbR family DNA-binding protein [Tetrasphaera japonica]CCH78835.1 conserved hypothetical protein [Tetrasphaera japonica T1-X7]